MEHPVFFNGEVEAFIVIFDPTFFDFTVYLIDVSAQAVAVFCGVIDWEGREFSKGVFLFVEEGDADGECDEEDATDDDEGEDLSAARCASCHDVLYVVEIVLNLRREGKFQFKITFQLRERLLRCMVDGELVEWNLPAVVVTGLDRKALNDSSEFIIFRSGITIEVGEDFEVEGGGRCGGEFHFDALEVVTGFESVDNARAEVFLEDAGDVFSDA